MTEDQLEQETLGWLKSLDYDYRFGPDIAFDGPTPERRDYRGVILHQRLEAALRKNNSGIPQVAIDDAIGQIMNLGSQSPLGSNRSFHQLLTTGIDVQY